MLILILNSSWFANTDLHNSMCGNNCGSRGWVKQKRCICILQSSLVTMQWLGSTDSDMHINKQATVYCATRLQELSSQCHTAAAGILLSSSGHHIATQKTAICSKNMTWQHQIWLNLGKICMSAAKFSSLLCSLVCKAEFDQRQWLAVVMIGRKLTTV